MVKKYEYTKFKPAGLSQLKENGTLSIVLERNRIATKRDIDRVKKLVAGGLPFPTVVLAKYYVDGKPRYRIVYGAGIITAILLYLDNATDKEASTSIFREFLQHDIDAVVVNKDANENNYLFEVFKGFNRKG